MAQWTHDPPRVLHVIDSLRTGGAEAFLTGLVKTLARSGRAENFVLAADPTGADQRFLATLRAHTGAVTLIAGRRLYDPRLLRGVLEAVRRHRIDVVQSHLCTANVNSRLAALVGHKPQVATLHTPPGSAREDSRARSLADGLTARLSTRLIVPSQAMADAYTRVYRIPRSKFRVVPSAPVAERPPDGLDRAALRAELGANEASSLVVCVARLKPEKGIDDLIAATDRLRRRLPNVLVVVAGGGPESEPLKREIAACGLEGQMRLLGPRADVGSILSVADAFCLPSRHEGLPISLLEGMQAGLACVSTAVGGVPEILTDGDTGLLVPPDAPERLADAIHRVLTDDALRRSLEIRGRRFVETSYSLPAVAARYGELYQELATTGRRDP